MVAALAAPSPEAVHRAIAAAVRSAPCAVVTGDDRTALGASLRGVTGRGEPESRLRTSVRDAAPQAIVDWQVAVADGPYCALLDVIRPYAAPFGGTARLLSVTLANGRTDLMAEDLVIPRVTMPDFAGYLQLDYVSSDGSLLHMHEARGGPPYAPDSTPVFGEPKPPAFKGWAVDEPFGTDLIVAVASSVPLFRVARPATDTLEAYLHDLRAALDQAARGGARISASVLLVRSSAKR